MTSVASVLLDRQRAAFLRDGIPDVATRRDRVSRLQAMVLDNADDLTTALAADFGTRPREISALTDIIGCIGDRRWTQRQRCLPRPGGIRDIHSRMRGRTI